MQDLKGFRKDWSSDLRKLRSMLKSGSSIKESWKLFLIIHEVLHRSSMSGVAGWTYSDEIFSGLSEADYRTVPPGSEHSLIWILWHISRIEDITLNLLIDGGNQVYKEKDWQDRLASPIHDTGNQITAEDHLALTRDVDPDTLHLYRDEVGRKTRSIVSQLNLERLGESVSQDGLNRIIDEGAVLPESVELLAYWGRKKIYQLLLMPPTRHLMVHLNEAITLKELIKKG
jgi:hypothetical protein